VFRTAKHEPSFGDDFDEEPEPIGTCVALYDFEGTCRVIYKHKDNVTLVRNSCKVYN